MTTDIKLKICSATFFVCVILHMLLGYFINLYSNSLDGYWYGFLFYAMVPLMPFVTGLKKIHITFEIAIVLTYFIVCIAVRMTTNGSVNLWHPLWVIFLLIPIYHIFNRKSPYAKQDNTKNKNQNYNGPYDV